MIISSSRLSVGRLITPEFLDSRIDAINHSSLVIADTNISAKALQFLIDRCTAPLMVDAVSTTKATRVTKALRQSHTHRLNVLKLNKQEALAVTHCDTVKSAADCLTDMGIEHIYITLGCEGVYCSDGTHHQHYEAIPTLVANTTGAGDAFIAGVAHAQLCGTTFPNCALTGLKAAHATLLSSQTVNPHVGRYCTNEEN